MPEHGSSDLFVDVEFSFFTFIFRRWIIDIAIVLSVLLVDSDANDPDTILLSSGQ